MTEQTDKMSLEQDLQISAKLAEAAYQALDDKLGQDIRILDIHHISILADYFLIAHGNNPNHVHALIDEVQDRLAELGCESKNVEGYQEGSWVLIDFGRIIVHVFSKEARLFYHLERIWSDGVTVDPKDLTIRKTQV